MTGIPPGMIPSMAAGIPPGVTLTMPGGYLGKERFLSYKTAMCKHARERKALSGSAT